MNPYNESRFRSQVDSALKSVRTVLENTRHPQYPADVPHQYDDKYSLAEFVTNTSLASQLNCLEALGLTQKSLQQLLKWAQSRSVTIRLKSEETCTYDREETRKVTSATEHVTEVKGLLSNVLSITDKVVTTITEYFWKFEVQYELFAFQGNNPDEKVLLQARKGCCEIKTSTKSTPRPQVTVVPSADINVSWLLSNVHENLSLKFSIDRSEKTCHTPRRNKQVDAALSYLRTFYSWAMQVHNYFTKLFPVQAEHGLDLSKINDNGIFVPVVPLFDESTQDVRKPLLSIGDLNQFLIEQKRSFGEKFGELAKMFPENGKIITLAEAKILVILLHARQICQHYADGVDYIEAMLYKQLEAAIGKVLTPVDFTNYMRYHNRQIFKAEYEPVQFCYAIRRPDHYPEGILSIEAQLDDGSLAEPILTTVRSSVATRPMYFSLDAATKVAFLGERYLHAWVSHQFAGNSGLSLSLNARARQFSSFLVLVGTIASADLFEPKYGIIIKNKDDLKIPLNLEQIPTPKEFRDAIESLSPEQQRFAKAIRSMQLAGTLFAVCVIQIKPQLEKLLRLPHDCLTKEIKLTQDLLELFIQYQIPSDLLSYDGNPNASGNEKLQAVKNHVATMQAMIQQARARELELAKEEQKFREAEEIVSKKFLEKKHVHKDKDMVKEKEKEKSPKDTKRKKKARPVEPKKASSALPVSPHVDTIAAPAPTAPSDSPSQPLEPVDKPSHDVAHVPQSGGEEEVVDYTTIPGKLDNMFEKLDEDSALRPTIITPGNTWTRRYQKALLAEPTQETITADSGQKIEKQKAFDLLDALSRAGALTIDSASLHVVLAATHCFDKSLVDTVIQDNINPIEKIERSTLIVATTIQNKPAIQLVKAEQLDRVKTYSPALFAPATYAEIEGAPMDADQ